MVIYYPNLTLGEHNILTITFDAYFGIGKSTDGKQVIAVEEIEEALDNITVKEFYANAEKFNYTCELAMLTHIVGNLKKKLCKSSQDSVSIDFSRWKGTSAYG